MAIFTSAHELANVFGVLGNVVSFLVYLSPLPTFVTVYKRKSTEGFQSIPYAVGLFSAMLYLYYAYLKGNQMLLLTINSVGTIIQSIYLTIFMIYATRKAKIYTTKLLLLFNVGAYGAIVLLVSLLAKEEIRVTIVGWICAVFSVSVFAAPLSIMRRVIRTRSVEYMPFFLSFFLTLCAIMWFFYGILIKDMYIATPNILGFSFGIAQMILYAIYRNKGLQQVQPDDNNNQAIIANDLVIDIDTKAMELQENPPHDHQNKQVEAEGGTQTNELESNGKTVEESGDQQSNV